jgi:hypothetical protein
MADQIIGAKLTLSTEEANKSMKQIKTDLKEAQAMLIATAAKFGENSQQAKAAAKNVAELKDKIGDAKSLVDAFNPDTKFKAIGQALNVVAGGFSAVQGMLALVGSEGDNVEKALLKVQAAMAFSQGFAQVQEGIQDFKNLKSVLIDTLGKGGAIGVGIAGLAALTYAIIESTKEVTAAEQAQDELRKSMEDYSSAAAKAIQEVEEVGAMFNLAREGVISKEEALKKYNDTLGDSLGRTNNLTEAERLLESKADAYIRVTGLKAQAQALFAEASKKSAEAIVLETEKLNTTQKAIAEQVGIINMVNDKRAKQVATIRETAKEINNLAEGLLKEAATISTASGVKFNPEKFKADTKNRIKLEKKIESEVAGEIATEQDTIPPAIRTEEMVNDKLTSLYSDRNRMIKISDDERRKNEHEASLARIELAEQEAQRKIETYRVVGDALGVLSSIVGKQTAAGKALGIAQALINAWVGASEVLRAPSVLPEPFATISKIANVAAIVKTGIEAVKNIVKVQVPGASSGSGSSLGSTAPLAPQLNASTTTLDQNSINQIGNAAGRSFVLDSDIQNQRERIERLNRAARI